MEIGITLIVTAGRGPKECRLVVVRVARKLSAEAERLGLSVACDLDDETQDAASVLVAIGGEGAEAYAAGWIGSVLWIDGDLRGGRARKNWFVAVHRLDEADTPKALVETDVRFDVMRAGGPGGQHQNVTESAVRATHIPTGLVAVARDGRSQHQNRKRALERLGALLAGVEAQAKMGAKRSEWLDRIAVERGNPIRTFRSI